MVREKQITTETKLLAMGIYTELKTGEEVPWNRIIKCFENISDEKNKHRNFKAYAIMKYYEENREEIRELFLLNLEEQIKEAKRKCGINIK